jgi:hypothetical protein
MSNGMAHDADIFGRQTLSVAFQMMLVCFIALLGNTLAVAGTVPQAFAEQVSFTPQPPSPDDVVDIVDTIYGPVAGNIGLDYRAYRGIEFKRRY